MKISLLITASVVGLAVLVSLVHSDNSKSNRSTEGDSPIFTAQQPQSMKKVEKTVKIGTVPALPNNAQQGGQPMEKATFAAGCFWGIEEAFRNVPGVVSTTVGYSGGKMDSPTYKDVCTDQTGHAEVVQVEFDPSRVSYEKLLDVFWEIHDPTTKDRQGPDVGTQYRSAVFYHSAEQKAAAAASKQKLAASRKFNRPIVTEITEAGTFWPAEEYHQRYLQKRGAASCHVR